MSVWLRQDDFNGLRHQDQAPIPLQVAEVFVESLEMIDVAQRQRQAVSAAVESELLTEIVVQRDDWQLVFPVDRHSHLRRRDGDCGAYAEQDRPPPSSVAAGVPGLASAPCIYLRLRVE